MKWILATLLALAVCEQEAHAARHASVKDLTAEERAEVVALADAGMSAFEAEDYASALVSFDAAEAIVEVPTVTLQRGRCLERLGRWVEAERSYQRVAALDVPTTSPAQHRVAKQDATKAYKALSPRVPVVVVRIRERSDAVEVMLDGRLLPTVEGSVRVDPGRHVFELRSASGASSRRELDAREGAEHEVVLVLDPPKKTPPESNGPMWKVLGITSVALGGASLATSLGTAIGAAQDGSSLDAVCKNGACPPEAWDDVDRYDALRYTAGTTLFIGLAFVGAGITTLVLAPSDEPSNEPSHESRAPEVMLLPAASLDSVGLTLRIRQ